MIKAIDLTKTMGDKLILDSINMNVKKGSIYGLVGENGAGKTTILNHVCGIYRGDSGSIEIDDSPVCENNAIKSRMYYIPDNLAFYTDRSLTAISKYFCKLYPRWSEELFDEIVNKFKLNKKTKISKMSKGMQKQAAFALALATLPDYLILDEPIDGLDPLVRKDVWKYIVDAVADRDLTVLVSSHNLKELEGFCDVIGIVSKGQMKIEREIDELKGKVNKIQLAFGKGKVVNYSGLNVLEREVKGSVEILIVNNTRKEILKFEEKYEPALLDIIPLSLEEVFIHELGGEQNV